MFSLATSTMSAPNNVPLESQAISNFREYLQIPSVHPNVDYDECVKFLEKQAKGLDLLIKIYHVVPKKPIVVITWTGTEPSLPTILLNSHMDVVPVFEEKWTHKPFSAHLDEETKKIYGRGTQDNKSVGIQYLEAIRKLKQQGVTLKRTVHVSFVPDEEIGGTDGMKQFVHTKDFQNLNVGVALDEGMASPYEQFVVFYAERVMWHFYIHCPGTPGHGSALPKNTAGEKMSYILQKLFEFRKQEQQKLVDNPTWNLGDVTSINLTQISGGIQINVLPSEFVIGIDCRITPSTDLQKWEDTINQWCKDAGPGVWIEYKLKQVLIPSTKLDNSNPYWVAFKEAADQLGIKLKPIICPGATDGRYVRGVGLPAIGFSPMNKTAPLPHGNDEHLGVDTFLKGIEIYSKIITSMGNVENKTD